MNKHTMGNSGALILNMAIHSRGTCSPPYPVFCTASTDTFTK